VSFGEGGGGARGREGGQLPRRQHNPGGVGAATATLPCRVHAPLPLPLPLPLVLVSPDPVDMDEDEKEMLSEARARLANTKGKKAKRKAREKMLEDAKRLASLQKLRELKAAGIDMSRRGKRLRKGEMDLGTEVPFRHDAPAGFFDTALEDARMVEERNARTVEFRGTLLNQAEHARVDAEEARHRKEDKARTRRFEAINLPAALKLTAPTGEGELPTMVGRKRPRMELPAPSVSDVELEEAVRLGLAAAGMGGAGALLDGASGMDDGGASMVTSSLLADYKASGGTAAILAARHAAAGTGLASSGALRRDAVLEEARNQAAEKGVGNALLGGDNPDMEEGTGFHGVTPSVNRTPAAVAAAGGAGRTGLRLPPPSETPAGAGTGGGGGHGSAGSIVGSSSVRGGGAVSVAAAAAATPAFRDSMGINRGDGDGGFSVDGGGATPSVSGFSVRTGTASLAANSLAPRHVAAGIALSLASLPAPKFAIDVAVPELPSGWDGDVSSLSRATGGTWRDVVDAAEEDARERAAEAAAAAEAHELRSSALKHVPALPRPLVLDDDAIAPASSALHAQLAAQQSALTGISQASGALAPLAAALAAAAALPPPDKPLTSAESLIRDEMLLLLKGDAVTDPVSAHRGGGWGKSMCGVRW